MNLNELEEYFLKRNSPKYERESYDSFLKKEGFSFSVPSIHITGTNGKGSTANYIYQIYLAKGYKVGLYNSPYLESCLEMISTNGNKSDIFSFSNEEKNEIKEINKEESKKGKNMLTNQNKNSKEKTGKYFRIQKISSNKS